MDKYDEIEGDAEYTVLRLVSGELLDVKVRDWEEHKRQFPEASAMEVARGLSRVDAENLTLLGNKQRNVENEDE